MGTVREIFSDAGDGVFPLAAGEGSGSISVNAAKPLATIAQLADYLVSGFWAYNNALPHKWASNTITYNITGLNADEQFLARSALAAWRDVANLTFIETTGTANITFTHNGSMQAVTNASWYGSGAMASATVNISTNWVTSDGGANDGKTGIDSYAYQTYIHEIGHALGLGHQGPYNGSAAYSANALYANDTWQYSIMSYFSQPNYSGSSYRYVVTPQMADIYAVGVMYGTATTTRTGDTVYGFNSNAGAVFSFGNYTSAPALTIYDNGGSDTLDCSLYSSAQRIDLHGGAFSSVGGLVNNIGIALNTVIEKAIGGSGNDMLIASDLGCTLMGGAGVDILTGGAGTDRLSGGSGVDTLTGAGGADNFVFALGDSSAASGQHDRIVDFVSGTDRIDLSAIDAVAGTAAIDLFRFLGSAAFDGAAGALNYVYNSASGITTLQGDTNGDRVADFAIDLAGNVALSLGDLIGVAQNSTVVEAVGSTSLVRVGTSFYLNTIGGGTGPLLKQGGTAFVAGQAGGWQPIAVEKTTTGYQVAWKVAGADQYSVWNTDSNGNYLGNAFGAVSGASTTLKSFESSFQQDINGDGIIGTTGTAVEAVGSTSLVQIGANFYLNSIGGGPGPLLKQGGTAFVAGQAGGWQPIAVEKTTTGYQVAWKVTGADQYSVWNTDSNGNYISNAIGVVSGASATMKSFETVFLQDFGGDGVVGAPVSGTVIESAGLTSLVQVGTNFYLNTIGGGTGPLLRQGGTAFVAGQAGGWQPIAVEKTTTGYQVAWKVTGADQYSVWNTDSNGNYISNAIGAVSGASTTLKSFETSFVQDLNGDGVVGAGSAATALGATSNGAFAGLFAGHQKFEGLACVQNESQHSAQNYFDGVGNNIDAILAGTYWNQFIVH